MIEEIRIRDLGVIGEAVLEPVPGFTAITGETGAGKTMLLSAVDLLLGGKADPALVRTGAERSQVEGRFYDVGEVATQRALDAGADLEDGALILGRTIVSAGRSRAFLGGRSVPSSVLAEVGNHLVTVHGQADQARLRSAARQREVVDEFAGPAHAVVLAQLRQAHALVRKAEDALNASQANARTRRLEVLSLTTALEEIDAVEPQPGEDIALREEADRLDNTEALRSSAEQARANLTGSEGGMLGAVGLLEAASRELGKALEVDPSVSEVAAQLAEAALTVAALDSEVGRYLGSLEADPTRLDRVHARRAVLGTLARTYGVPWAERTDLDPPAGSVDAVITWAAAARARLNELTGPGQDTESLTRHLAEVTRQRDALAAEVTRARTTAAEALAAAVTSELAGLAMASSVIHVELTPIPPTSHGAEDVAILLTPYPGAPARPLGQGASGGELSRVMLALEVSLAAARGDAAGGTFIFDEVDAGIGGRTASQVGARLAALSRTAQVIVVTHLAQVAAYADRQIVVAKGMGDGLTLTQVRTVEDDEREHELARMLSGETSDTAIRHAADLLVRAERGSIEGT